MDQEKCVKYEAPKSSSSSSKSSKSGSGSGSKDKLTKIEKMLANGDFLGPCDNTCRATGTPIAPPPPCGAQLIADFENGSLGGVTAVGGTINADCGVANGTGALQFDAAGTRTATIGPIIYGTGAALQFQIVFGSTGTLCENADPGEDVIVSVNGIPVQTLDTEAYLTFTSVIVPLPAGSVGQPVTIELSQPLHSGANFDNWAIDDVEVVCLSGDVCDLQVCVTTNGFGDEVEYTVTSANLGSILSDANVAFGATTCQSTLLFSDPGAITLDFNSAGTFNDNSGSVSVFSNGNLDTTFAFAGGQTFNGISLSSCNTPKQSPKPVLAKVAAGVDRINAFPNPFTDNTTISFTLGDDADVVLEVYNTNGAVVAELFNGKVLANTKTNINFDATNLPSGTYIYRLNTGSDVKHGKLTVIK
jgi:hypothetical protein